MNKNSTFLYFAYGSNLLSKRIHLQNPTAVRKCTGKLKDHRLDFVGYAKRWGGAPATIVPHIGECVWGAIWEISMKNLPDLDDQEGVSQNIYFPKTVDICTDDNEIVSCRIYQNCIDPSPNINSYPNEKPSHIYLSIIIKGAIESKLPQYYIDKLQLLPHNDYMGDTEMGKNITNVIIDIIKI